MKKKAIKIPKIIPKPKVKKNLLPGTNKIVFDLKQVEAIGTIQCTYEEMAAVLGCSADTVTRRMKEDTAFAEAYKKGIEGGKASVKRTQFKMAMNGNATMLIWFGKQHLGQTDKVVQKNINAGSLALLTHLSPKERLEALKRGLMDNPAGAGNGNNNAADANK
jgi:hypothetical protein